MPDYKELYFTLYARVVTLTEELIDLQKNMEELYLKDSESDKVVTFKNVEN